MGPLKISSSGVMGRAGFHEDIEARPDGGLKERGEAIPLGGG